MKKYHFLAHASKNLYIPSRSLEGHVNYRKCADRLRLRRPHLCSVADGGTLCCRCDSCRSLSPENAIYLAGTGRAGPYLYGSNVHSQLWQCRSGVNTRIDSLKDFHLHWKIKYKSSFNGNDNIKVGYLGKEVYTTSACCLV